MPNHCRRQTSAHCSRLHSYLRRNSRSEIIKRGDDGTLYGRRSPALTRISLTALLAPRSSIICHAPTDCKSRTLDLLTAETLLLYVLPGTGSFGSGAYSLRGPPSSRSTEMPRNAGSLAKTHGESRLLDADRPPIRYGRRNGSTYTVCKPSRSRPSRRRL